jgi:hypothetical protein
MKPLKFTYLNSTEDGLKEDSTSSLMAEDLVDKDKQRFDAIELERLKKEVEIEDKIERGESLVIKVPSFEEYCKEVGEQIETELQRLKKIGDFRRLRLNAVMMSSSENRRLFKAALKNKYKQLYGKN